MDLRRTQLTVLSNALYETDSTPVTVSHPSDEVGDLLEFDLGPGDASEVRVLADAEDYADARTAVQQAHGDPAAEELPEWRAYVNAFVAGGLLEPSNAAELEAFLDRHGSPDLSAGHKPVVAGFDTNLVPWQLADRLGLSPGQDGTVNGYALATGVRDELDWNYKRDDTRALEAAFGDEFDALWNQPAGANRQGRLGEIHYRQLRDHRYADEVPSDTGDEAIVSAYDEYQTDGRKDVLLFSNDRDFVELAKSHRILAQRVEFPDALPESMTASWSAIQDTLYVLTVLFGVLTLPKVTLYGVWKGKGGQAWHDERLRVDCRSPAVEPLLERDLEILDAR